MRAAAAEPVEGLWDLPEGWRWVTIGDVCSYISRGRSPTYVAGDGVRIINQKCVRWAGIDPRFTKLTASAAAARLVPDQYLRADDVLWNSTGTGTIGRACIVRNEDLDQPTVVDSHVTVLRASAVAAAWLRYWIEIPFVQKAVTGIGSTNQVELARSTILAMPIPFADLGTQREIVARIDALFVEVEDGEAALARARADLGTWRKALLKAAVTGELTADWRAERLKEDGPPQETGTDLLARILTERRTRWHAEPRNKGKRYVEPAGPDTEELPELPEDWTWGTLSQLCTVITSGSRAWSQYYGRGTSTFIMAQNVRAGRYDSRFHQRVDPPANDAERARTAVLRDDLLLTIVGANTGDLCRVDFEPADHYVCQSVALLRLADPTLAPVIEAFFANEFGRKLQMEEMIYGAGRPHLSFDQIKELAVPIAPASERPELRRVLANLSSGIEAASKEMVDLTPASATLRQAILAAAFRGTLTA